MSTASNTVEFLYHPILHGQIMLNTLLAKLIKGLVSLIALISIYYLLLHAFFFILVLSCVGQGKRPNEFVEWHVAPLAE